MTSMEQFKLPDVGEGLTDAEISTWHVAVGDVVEVNQVIVEIETAKSMVELPSPFAGTVSELHAAEGETVDVGRPLISIARATSPGSDEPESEEPTAKPPHPVSFAGLEPKLLVGYGPRETTRRRRRRSQRPEGDDSGDRAQSPSVEGLSKAKPPVRKLAKVLGVDLASVKPTGPGGIITRSDVMNASDEASQIDEPRARLKTGESAVDIRIPIKGVRKRTAEAMVASAFTAPHVTEFVALDITQTMELRLEIGRRREFANVKLSPFCFVARAFLKALQLTPSANSRWDEAAQEIVQMGEINLGIAAATPRGLVVPNIKSAQQLTLAELATAIAELADTARAGKTDLAAMSNGTVTLSNFGMFGVDAGTPILNPGETAILGVGAIRRMPWVVGTGPDERIEPRWVTELALSFDHRVMDGQQGSELLADTASLLSNPGLAFL